jgi:hypothetical protein
VQPRSIEQGAGGAAAWASPSRSRLDYALHVCECKPWLVHAHPNFGARQQEEGVGGGEGEGCVKEGEGLAMSAPLDVHLRGGKKGEGERARLLSRGWVGEYLT